MSKQNQTLLIGIITIVSIFILLCYVLLAIEKSFHEPEIKSETKELVTKDSAFEFTEADYFPLEEIDLPSEYDKCIKHLKQYEFFKPCEYPGASGNRLIGYGHTIYKDMPCITETQADSMLRVDFDQRIDYVIRKYRNLCTNEKKTFALALFCFNIRPSTSKYAIPKIVKDSNRWHQYQYYLPEGDSVMRKNKGLRARRGVETKMYF